MTFPLPPINSARDAADVMSHLMNAVAAGQITPTDAAEISKVVACTVKAFETAEFAGHSTRPTKTALFDAGYSAKCVTLSLALRSSGDADRGFGRVGAEAALAAG